MMTTRRALTTNQPDELSIVLPRVPQMFYPCSMVRHRLRTLSDLIRNGYWVKLICRCGHTVRKDPSELQELLAERGASTRLDALSDSLKCQACGGKEFDVLQCYGPEVWSR